MSTLIKATGLWRKTSGKTGREYFVGRLGGLRILIFESTDRQGDSDPSHLLMLGDAEERDQSPRQETALAARHRIDRQLARMQRDEERGRS
jgi:hypothetical protein